MEDYLSQNNSASSDYQSHFYTPTYVTKYDEYYFIVDCWHHRILYSSFLLLPPREWNILDERICGPHSIASNGIIYVAESTGENSIKVYRKNGSQFSHIQTLSNIGRRPHRTIFSELLQIFIVLTSGDQHIHIFKEVEGILISVFHKNIKELSGQYCRSMHLKDNILFIVGFNKIVTLCIDKFTLHVTHLRTYLLPENLKIAYGINDIYVYDSGAILISLYPGVLIGSSSIMDLEKGNYIDLSKHVKGTPYYINKIYDILVIPEIDSYSRVCLYPNIFLDQGTFCSTRPEVIRDFGAPTNESIARKKSIRSKILIFSHK